MICPECQAEFREGFTTCSDCHVPLVEPGGAGAHAAGGEEGEPGEFFNPGGPFHTTNDSLFLAELLEALETGGVPYAFEAGTALDLLTGGDVDDMPGTWEARLHVHPDHRERAREILEEVAAAIRARPQQEPVSGSE